MQAHYSTKESYHRGSTSHARDSLGSNDHDVPKDAHERAEANEVGAPRQYGLVSSEDVDCVKSLPPYDQALGTRNICVAGLLFSWALGFTCIGLAQWTFRGGQAFLARTGGYTVDNNGEHTFSLNGASQEVVKLVINICIAICTDCLGYIHSTSVRWALKREGRLQFNSNLRLFASTRGCSSSRWSTNIVSAFLLMACYASSGQLFLSTDVAEGEGFVLSGIAIAALGIGILGQAAISTVCLVHSSELIPTWSSNPLNTVLVLLHDGAIRRRAGRSILSVRSMNAPSGPYPPTIRQPVLRHARSQARHITHLLWVLFAFSFLWAIPIVAISAVTKVRYILIFGPGAPALEVNLTALLITIGFQAGLTLCVHATELLVNVSRDEALWRRAISREGVQSSYGALDSVRAAAASWQALFLFALKPVTHWLFGLSLNNEGGSVIMNWKGVVPLSAAGLVLALFGTFLGRKRITDPLPVAFGHLQTLANLIDVWPVHDGQQTLFWGDKGAVVEGEWANKEVRHAGTDTRPLRPVRACMYA
ncbi:MAG: hypothetical protein M1828_000926 [Chrysothrix sp. TS-e1954]|nr:MAG: hypothetical protein M1828_000926 [Chrysothrix sp. TS-e1954]